MCDVIHFYIPGCVQGKIKVMFGIAKDAEVRLWQRYLTNSYGLVKDSTQNLHVAEVGICEGQVTESIRIINISHCST